ncbi:MAG: DUF58 domain-containing protein [Candidatus Omnitrophica bacterium]|nr:DUF58 domain-containing protein [Candidatus Omnitrophota bacterium]
MKIIENAKKLPVEQRWGALKEILHLFYYTTNPELKKYFGTEGDFLKFEFKYFAVTCDSASRLSAVLAHELNVPAIFAGGYFSENMGIFENGQRHAFLITPGGVFEVTAYVGEKSPLYGVSATDADYREEMEYIKERARNISSMLPGMGELSELDAEKRQLEETLQKVKEKTDEVISVSDNAGKDHYFSLRAYYDGEIEKFNIREMAAHRDETAVYARGILQDLERSEISAQNSAQLMALGHFKLALAHQIELYFPELGKEARAVKNSIYEKIKIFAESPERRWSFQEDLPGTPPGALYITRWTNPGTESLTVVPVFSKEGELVKKIATDIYTGEKFVMEPNIEITEYRGGILRVIIHKGHKGGVDIRSEALMGNRIKGINREIRYLQYGAINTPLTECLSIQYLFTAANGNWLAVLDNEFFGSMAQGFKKKGLKREISGVLGVDITPDGSWVARVITSEEEYMYCGMFNRKFFCEDPMVIEIMPPLFFDKTWAGIGVLKFSSAIAVNLQQLAGLKPVGPGAEKLNKWTGGADIIDWQAVSVDNFVIAIKPQGEGYKLVGPLVESLGVAGKVYTEPIRICRVYKQGLILLDVFDGTHKREISNEMAKLSAWSSHVLFQGPKAEWQIAQDKDIKKVVEYPRFLSDGTWVACVENSDGTMKFIGTAVGRVVANLRFDKIIKYGCSDPDMRLLPKFPVGPVSDVSNAGIFVSENAVGTESGSSRISSAWSARVQNFKGVSLLPNADSGLIQEHSEIGGMITANPGTMPIMTRNGLAYMCSGMNGQLYLGSGNDVDLYIELNPQTRMFKVRGPMAKEMNVEGAEFPLDNVVSLIRIADDKTDYLGKSLEKEPSSVGIKTVYPENAPLLETGTDSLLFTVRAPYGNIESETHFRGPWRTNWLASVVDQYGITSETARSSMPHRIDAEFRYISRVADKNFERGKEQLLEFLKTLKILREKGNIYNDENTGPSQSIDPRDLAEFIKKHHREISYCEGIIYSMINSGIFDSLRGTEYEYLIVDALVEFVDDYVEKDAMESGKMTMRMIYAMDIIEKIGLDPFENYLRHYRDEFGLPEKYSDYIKFMWPDSFNGNFQKEIAGLNQLLLKAYKRAGESDGAVLLFCKKVEKVHRLVELISMGSVSRDDHKRKTSGDKVVLTLKEIADVVIVDERGVRLKKFDDNAGATLEKVFYTLRGLTGDESLYFDVEISKESRSNPLWILTRLFRLSPEYLKLKYAVLGEILADSKSYIDEYNKMCANLKSWNETNKKLLEILGDDYEGAEVPATIWGDFWKEFSHNAPAVLLMVGIIAFLLSYGSDAMRKKDLIVGGSAKKTIRKMREKAFWFKGKRADIGESLLDAILQLRGKPLDHGQRARMNIFRASLPDNQRALFDIMLCVAVEAPGKKRNIFKRLANLVPLGSLAVVWDTLDMRQRQSMNRDLLRLVESIDAQTSHQDIYRALRETVDKYLDKNTPIVSDQVPGQRNFEQFKRKMIDELKTGMVLRVDNRRKFVSNPNGSSVMRPGDNGDFYELREYADGDDARNIDAYATVRSGKPMVKVFEKDVTSPASILIDMRLINDSKNEDVWVEDLVKSLIVMYDKRRVHQKNLFSLRGLIFIMPDGSIKEEANFYGNRFNIRGAGLRNLFNVLRARYEEAANVKVHTDLVFYTLEQNRRRALLAGSIFAEDANDSVMKNLDKLQRLKKHSAQVFCVGIQNDNKDDVVRALSRNGVVPFFWNKGVASPRFFRTQSYSSMIRALPFKVNHFMKTVARGGAGKLVSILMLVGVFAGVWSFYTDALASTMQTANTLVSSGFPLGEALSGLLIIFAAVGYIVYFGDDSHGRPVKEPKEDNTQEAAGAGPEKTIVTPAEPADSMSEEQVPPVTETQHDVPVTPQAAMDVSQTPAEGPGPQNLQAELANNVVIKTEGTINIGKPDKNIPINENKNDQEKSASAMEQELNNIRDLEKSDVTAIVVLNEKDRLKALEGIGKINMTNLSNLAGRVVSHKRLSKVIYVETVEEAIVRAGKLQNRDWTNTFIYIDEEIAKSESENYNKLKENFLVWNLNIPSDSLCGVTPLGFLVMSLKLNDLIKRSQNGSVKFDLESLARIILLNINEEITEANIQEIVEKVLKPIAAAKTKSDLLVLSGKLTLYLPKIQPSNWTEVSEQFKALEKVYQAL